MPLQDHYRPPLSSRRHWHAFHNSWATYLSSDLNRQLAPSYFAEGNVQFGVEIDVAAFEDTDQPVGPSSPWSPPNPVLTLPFALTTDIVEVLVFHDEGGPVLAGALELVSPANKDRPAQREAFVSKCASYLQQGIGLIIVDVVTGRRAHLHEDLLTRVQAGPGREFAADLFAAAYRPTSRNGEPQLEIWPEVLPIGRPLPTLPLGLWGGFCLPVDLEASYERTCRERP